MYWSGRMVIALVIIIKLLILFGLMIYTAINRSPIEDEIEEIISTQEKNKTCTSDDDCVHGVCCYSKGGCICDEGYWGELCAESVYEGCKNETACCGEHGECCCDGKCRCFDGWYGEHCEHPPNCLANGTACLIVDDCNGFPCHYGVCVCTDPNYTGDSCELARRDLSICSTDEDCLNGGVCKDNLSHDKGECYCPAGTSGNNCQNLLI